MCDLWEAEEEDDVDDGEGEHVSRYHREDHRHERSRQLHGSKTTFLENKASTFSFKSVLASEHDEIFSLVDGGLETTLKAPSSDLALSSPSPPPPPISSDKKGKPENVRQGFANNF